jgi:hypothetical protein
MPEHPLIGTWHLVSFELRDEEDPATRAGATLLPSQTHLRAPPASSIRPRFSCRSGMDQRRHGGAVPPSRCGPVTG